MGRKRPGCCRGWQLPHSEGTLLARPPSGRDWRARSQRLQMFQHVASAPWNDSSRWGLRDKAGNRELFFDQYAALLLLYFFNPVIKSMRALQRSTKLEKVQRLLGVRPTSLGSLSEATEVLPQRALAAGHPFRKSLVGLCRCIKVVRPRPSKISCANRWHPILARPAKNGLGLVDGRPAPSGQNSIPSISMFSKACPFDATLTPAACSEPEQLRANMPQSGRLLRHRSGLCRLQAIPRYSERLRRPSLAASRDNTAFTVKEEQTLTPEAIAAGVVRDVILAKLGTPKAQRRHRQTRASGDCSPPQDRWHMGRTLARHGSPRHVSPTWWHPGVSLSMDH